MKAQIEQFKRKSAKLAGKIIELQDQKDKIDAVIELLEPSGK